MSSPKHTWSSYQQAIFARVAAGTGHLVVQARAGAAKTTSIIEAMRHVPAGKSVLLAAFGNLIAKELAARAPSGVEVRTLHSYGYAVVRGAWGRHVKLNADRDRDLAEAALAEARVRAADRELVRGSFVKLVGLAKANLALTAEAVTEVAYSHGLVPTWSELELVDHGPRAGEPKYGDADLAAWTLAAMRAACKKGPEISYDDMVFVAAVMGMSGTQFDFVFVDETQDMTAAQLKLARKALKPSGRLIAVGDPNQAIFAFRGADEQAMPRIIRELQAEVLPLSVSYRCPRAVAAMAREYVPDFASPDHAIEGVVAELAGEQMKDLWRPGDWVLSRTNAPLVGLCLAALKAGVPAKIQGRDIAGGLLTLIRKAKARRVEDLLEWVGEWESTEVAKLVSAKKEDKVESVRDRAETVRALADGCDLTSEVVVRLEKLFSDDKTSAALNFSSTHRAKGLEGDRVFVLVSTYRPWRSQEEANLWYVAITRTKRELYLVDPPKVGGQRPYEGHYPVLGAPVPHTVNDFDEDAEEMPCA